MFWSNLKGSVFPSGGLHKKSNTLYCFSQATKIIIYVFCTVSVIAYPNFFTYTKKQTPELFYKKSSS